jgi:hypothetical protein
MKQALLTSTASLICKFASAFAPQCGVRCSRLVASPRQNAFVQATAAVTDGSDVQQELQRLSQQQDDLEQRLS